MPIVKIDADLLQNDPSTAQGFINDVVDEIELLNLNSAEEGDTYTLSATDGMNQVTVNLDAETGTDSSFDIIQGTGITVNVNSDGNMVIGAVGGGDTGNYVEVNTMTGVITDGTNTFQYLYRYLHTRFSASANGASFVTNPALVAGSTIYIGLANRTSVTAPTEATAYNWVSYEWSVPHNVFYRKTGGNRVEFLTSTASAISNAIQFATGDSPLDFNTLEINTGNIADNAVTIAKLNVEKLSAITADIGDINAGTIKGGTLPDANAPPSGTEQGSFFNLIAGTVVLGNATDYLYWNGTTLNLSGVSITGASITGSDIEGAKLQDYMDLTAYTVDDIVISDDRIFQAINAIPATNTTNPEDNSTDWREIAKKLTNAEVITAAETNANLKSLIDAVSPVFTDTTYPNVTATTGGVLTDTQAAKFDGIATGADANVQSDYTQTDDTADDFIKNKPTISDGNIQFAFTPSDVISNANFTLNGPGKFLTLTIKDGVVTTAKIADNAITTAKVADNAITDAKLANSYATATQGTNADTALASTITNATAIALNTAKTGISTDQANAIVANTAKVGITTEQAAAIVANTAKSSLTPEQAAAITANTAKVGITTEQAAAITANTAKTGITVAQANAILDNSNKVGITTAQASAITANTAKVGITSDQANAIVANTAKVGITTAQSTKLAGIATGAEVNVQSDWDQTDNTAADYIENKPTISDGAIQFAFNPSDVVSNANFTLNGPGKFITLTIKNGVVTTAKIVDDAITTAKINDGSVTKDKLSSDVTALIDANTSKTGITSAQTAAIIANTAKVGITTAQAAAITANTAKKEITPEQASAITANTAKVGITTAQASAITANTAKVGITTNQTNKLAGIEDNATADQTGAQIKAAYEAETKAFTDAQFDKLATVANDADANVQSDYTQTDNTADDFIKNKPTIGNGLISFPALAEVTTTATFNLNDADNTALSLAIRDGVISSAKLATGAVTSVKLADDAISTAKIANLAVTTAKIADGAVTAPKVGPAVINFEKVAVNQMQNLVFTTMYTDINSTQTPSPGQLYMSTTPTGPNRVGNNTPWSTLKSIRMNVRDNNSLFNGNIIDLFSANNSYIELDDGVGNYATSLVIAIYDNTSGSGDNRTGAWLMTLAEPLRSAGVIKRDADYSLSLQIHTDTVVTGDLIVDGTVTAEKIAANAITAGKIAADAITADNIAANAITAEKIMADAITADKIMANAITAEKITANAISAEKIAADAITAVKIQADAVTANKIQADAVTANKIAANAVTAVKINADAITADKIATNAVTADSINANAVTATKIVADAITSDKISGANGTFDNFVSEYGKIAVVAAENIDTNVLNSNVVTVKALSSSDFDGSFNTDLTIDALGTVGWGIGKAGKAVFNEVEVRGNSVVQTAAIGGQALYTSSNDGLDSTLDGALAGGDNPGEDFATDRLWTTITIPVGFINATASSSATFFPVARLDTGLDATNKASFTSSDITCSYIYRFYNIQGTQLGSSVTQNFSCTYADAIFESVTGNINFDGAGVQDLTLPSGTVEVTVSVSFGVDNTVNWGINSILGSGIQYSGLIDKPTNATSFLASGDEDKYAVEVAGGLGLYAPGKLIFNGSSTSVALFGQGLDTDDGGFVMYVRTTWDDSDPSFFGVEAAIFPIYFHPSNVNEDTSYPIFSEYESPGPGPLYVGRITILKTSGNPFQLLFSTTGADSRFTNQAMEQVWVGYRW